MDNSKSRKGFKNSIVTLLLFAAMIMLQIITYKLKLDSLSLGVGILVLIIGVVSIYGFINSLKGIKDPNSFQKIFGLIVNSVFVALFFLMIVANILDLKHAFE